MEVDHVLVVRESQSAADEMNIAVGSPEKTGCEGFDTKGGNATLAEPTGCIRGETGAIRPVARGESATVMICVEENCVAAPDVETGHRECCLQVSDVDGFAQVLRR